MNNAELSRSLAISASRLGDIAMREGDRQAAESLYLKDFAITEKLAQELPFHSEILIG